MCPISFEFFPPQSEAALKTLAVHQKSLAQFNPDYVSVTFGAFGGQQDFSLDAVRQAVDIFSAPKVVPHISCVWMNAERLSEYLKFYRSLGISRLIVVRGDQPEDTTAQECFASYNHASALMAAIEDIAPGVFSMIVAGYPELHPESENWGTEISYLKKKVSLGAAEIITQYFFSMAAYVRFAEDCAANGITAPIRAGLIPIAGVAQLLRISERCGADVPRWLLSRLQSYQDDPVRFEMFCHGVLCDLCAKLMHAGAPGIHFYTLNKSEKVIKILREISL